MAFHKHSTTVTIGTKDDDKGFIAGLISFTGEIQDSHGAAEAHKALDAILSAIQAEMNFCHEVMLPSRTNSR